MQDVRLGVLPPHSALYLLTSPHFLATLARGGMLLDPTDAGTIGVEAAVHRLEEGVLQMDMVWLFSSAGS